MGMCQLLIKFTERRNGNTGKNVYQLCLEGKFVRNQLLYVSKGNQLRIEISVGESLMKDKTKRGVLLYYTTFTASQYTNNRQIISTQPSSHHKPENLKTLVKLTTTGENKKSITSSPMSTKAESTERTINMMYFKSQNVKIRPATNSSIRTTNDKVSILTNSFFTIIWPRHVPYLIEQCNYFG